MAYQYQATVEVDCWKQHVCVGCGSAFRYRLRRTVVGEAYTEEQARTRARRAAEDVLKSGVDQRPCPWCGLYQPDMVGAWRAVRHYAVVFFSTLAILLAAALVYFELLPRHVFTWLATGVAAAAVLLHWLVARRDPNRDLAANRARVEEGVRKGELELLHPGKPEDAADPPTVGFTPAHRTAFLLLLVGVLVVAAPELLRLMCDWPLNPSWAPTVVGPGETATFAFDDKLKSIQGMWRGDADVKVLNADELGVAALHDINYETGHAAWGTMIHTKLSESEKGWHPWVRVRVPPDPQLAGRTLRLHIRLEATYPTGVLFFEEKKRTFETETVLRLATSENASGYYDKAWWVGFVGGVVWMALAGVGLRQLQQALAEKALPTLVAPVKEEEKTEEND